MTDPAALPRAIEEIRALWIPLADGRRLAARVWLPTDAGSNPVPAIVEAIPYRRLDGTVLGDALTHPWWAAHGYAAIRLDIAGSGDSDGLLLDEYLASEQDDVCEALAWIAARPWCSGATGVIGISWGGFAALQVAARRPPSLKAVVACCATDDRYADDVHYMGGCLLTDNVSWGGGIFACVSRWPNPEVVGERWRAMWLERLEGTGCPLIGWTRHQRRDAFWKHGSVREDYGAVEAAVYAVGGWTDGYTNALLRLMERLPGPKRALIGPWTHVYPHFGTPGEPVGFLQDGLRWWDRWLKGIDNGVDREPALNLWMQEDIRPHPMTFDVGGRWIGETSWPPPARRLSLALGDGTLSADGPGDAVTLRHASPLACGAAGGEWCPRDGGGAGPEYQGDQRVDDVLSLRFETEPLKEPVAVLGAPVLRLALSIDRPQGMIAVRLNEVAEDGRSARVTFGLLNLSHRNSHEAPEPMTPGRMERIEARLNDVAYRFRPGRRIRLAVSTSYWPMAWPSPEPVTLTLDTRDARLDLPVRDGGGREVAFEAPEFPPAHPARVLEPAGFRRTLTRDVGTGALVLRHEEDAGRVLIEDIGLVVAKRSEETFSIVEGDPASARVDTARVVGAERGDWRPRTETRLAFSCDAGAFRVAASLEAYEGERRILERRWDETIPRDRL